MSVVNNIAKCREIQRNGLTVNIPTDSPVERTYFQAYVTSYLDSKALILKEAIYGAR